MGISLQTCLWFDHQAKEAATLYVGVFKNASITGENPINVSLEISGSRFLLLNGGPQFRINPSISFFVICDSREEITEKWEKLTENGSVLMPLNKYPWSEQYGWCQDRFGVNWQLMRSKDFGQTIIPCLMFTGPNSGKAESAMNSYTTIFKDARIQMISRYEKGEGDTEGHIKHAQFVLNGQLFIAMDSSLPHGFNFSEGVSFIVECDEQSEVDHYWQELSKGGQQVQCGWLKDPFGVSWQVIPSVLGKLMSDPSKAAKVTAAMLQMKKMDIEGLKSAAQ